MNKEENVFVPSVKLFVICLVVALCLSALNYVTAPIIEAANEQKKKDAMSTVLEGCTFEEINGTGVYEAKKDGETEGYAASVTSPIGYGGDIELIVGFDNDLNVTGVSFIKMSETNGIGTKTRDESWFTEQFIGKNVPSESDFKAVTGATISSKAVRYGLELASDAVKEACGK